MEQKLEGNNQQQTRYQNKEIEDLIEWNWISIKDNETRVLQFMPEKSKVVDKTDFSGKPVKKVQFCVTDVNKSGVKENFFEVSRAHAAKIYEELKAGKTVLEISRLGTGKANLSFRLDNSFSLFSSTFLIKRKERLAPTRRVPYIIMKPYAIISFMATMYYAFYTITTLKS
jgi:hypothetical protein